MGWKAEPSANLSKAPKEVREAIEACAQEISRELNSFKVKSPNNEKLQEMLTAGEGEHRDRLFSIAVRHALAEMFDRVTDMVEAHRQQFKAQYGTDGENGNKLERYDRSN